MHRVDTGWTTVHKRRLTRAVELAVERLSAAVSAGRDWKPELVMLIARLVPLKSDNVKASLLLLAHGSIRRSGSEWFAEAAPVDGPALRGNGGSCGEALTDFCRDWHAKIGTGRALPAAVAVGAGDEDSGGAEPKAPR